MKKEPSSGTDTAISRVLQDTFDELQAELLRQRKELKEAGGEPPTATLSIEEAVTQLAGHEGFAVKSLLGAGGMGAVVEAMDLKLKRTVALKFLPPEVISDPKNAQELRHEAEITSRIQNENVVQIFSWHEVDNVPFYAMEFVEGETVEQYVNRRGRLPAYEALRITAEAARGLEALHKSGIIHRDIKPQNILLSKDGRVKITDFGISRTQEMITTEVLRARKIAGTPKFMSPEQARGEAATKHSDIYSLGATLYFMLTGRPPVEAAPDLREQIQYVRDGKIVPILKVLPKINKDLARLVSRCLSPIQSRRPWDVETLRHELDRAFLAETVHSSTTVRALLVRHRKYLFPIMALAVGMLIGFFAGEGITSARYTGQLPSNDELIQLARDEAEYVDELLKQVQPREEDERLRLKLQQAIDHEAGGQVATLMPYISSLAHRLEIVQTVRREAADPTSPLHKDATELLQTIKQEEPESAGEKLRDWRTAWLETVKRSEARLERTVQPPPTPTLAPPASAERK